MSHGSISHGSMQGDDTWNIKYELINHTLTKMLQ